MAAQKQQAILEEIREIALMYTHSLSGSCSGCSSGSFNRKFRLISLVSFALLICDKEPGRSIAISAKKLNESVRVYKTYKTYCSGSFCFRLFYLMAIYQRKCVSKKGI